MPSLLYINLSLIIIIIIKKTYLNYKHCLQRHLVENQQMQVVCGGI
jgi:hypothetical protein